MSLELDDVSVRIIGNNYRGLQWYDDGGNLRAEIYLDSANRLNIGGSLIVGAEGGSSSGSSGGSGGDATFPAGVPFLTLATDSALSAERVFTPGSGLSAADGGANGAYTLSVDATVVRTTRTISNGTGITGGGDLSANRTLAIDTAVGLTWSALQTFGAGLAISGANTLTFGGDVALSRTGANILSVAGGDQVQSNNYSSGVSGYMISDPLAEFANVRIRGELVSTVLKFNEMAATNGTEITPKGASTTSADFTTPASVGSSFTLSAKDSDDGGARFAVNDVLWVKTYQGASIRSIYATVTAVGAQSGVAPNQTHAYTCTLSNGSTSATIRAGTAIANLGPSGFGWISLSADGGVGYSANLSIVTHGGSPWTDQVLRARLGNLRGSYGIDASTDRYGIGMGDYASGKYLFYDTGRGLEMRAGAGAVGIDESGIRLTKGAGTSVGALKWYDSTSFASQVGGLSIDRGTYVDALFSTDATGFDQYSRTYLAAIGDTAAANSRRETYLEVNTGAASRWGVIIYGGGNDAANGGGLQVSATDQGQVGVVNRGVGHAQSGFKVGTWSAGVFDRKSELLDDHVLVRGGSGSGYAVAYGGDGSRTGWLGWHRGDSTRHAYMGYSLAGSLDLVLENGSNLNISGGVVASSVINGAIAASNANQSINNATLTVVGFNVEAADNNGLFTTFDNTKMTAPTNGVYLITAMLAFASNATGYRVVYLRINGTDYKTMDSRPAVNGERTAFTHTAQLLMNAGDYVQVVVYQTSGGALNVEAQSYSMYYYASRLV